MKKKKHINNVVISNELSKKMLELFSFCNFINPVGRYFISQLKFH